MNSATVEKKEAYMGLWLGQLLFKGLHQCCADCISQANNGRAEHQVGVFPSFFFFVFHLNSSVANQGKEM